MKDSTRNNSTNGNGIGYASSSHTNRSTNNTNNTNNSTSSNSKGVLSMHPALVLVLGTLLFFGGATWDSFNNSRHEQSSSSPELRVVRTPSLASSPSFSSSFFLQDDEEDGDFDEPISNVTAPSIVTTPTQTWSATSFMHQPDEMVMAFAACEVDPDCHIMFHHAYKTGGTTIEYSMRKIFHEKKTFSCCEDRMMNKFHRDKDFYCKRKFSAYQVGHEDFLEVLDACQHKKVLVLTSFRDPVSLMVSWIHQMCNKLESRRSEEVLQACNACDFNQYTDVWMSMANETLRQLNNVWQVSQFNPADYPILEGRDVQVFALELPDVSAFFKSWKPAMELPLGRNAEDLHRCNFYTPSTLIKYLRPGNEIYRHLVAGA
jgi:hypothetical protein